MKAGDRTTKSKESNNQMKHTIAINLASKLGVSVKNNPSNKTFPYRVEIGPLKVPVTSLVAAGRLIGLENLKRGGVRVSAL